MGQFKLFRVSDAGADGIVNVFFRADADKRIAYNVLFHIGDTGYGYSSAGSFIPDGILSIGVGTMGYQLAVEKGVDVATAEITIGYADAPVSARETATCTIHLFKYTHDNVNIGKLYRCLSDGTKSDSGTYFRLEFLADWLIDNSYTVRWRVKELGDDYGSWTVLGTATKGNLYGYTINANLDPTKAYDLQLGVGDSSDVIFYTDAKIPASDVTVHMASGGKAIGVGMKAGNEDNTLYSAWAFRGAEASDVLAFALNCHTGITPLTTSATTSNLPSADYQNTNGMVSKFGARTTVYLEGEGTIATNVHTTSWSGWKYITPQ